MIIVYNIQALSGCSADGSVLGSGPRGREFKSRHSDHPNPLRRFVSGDFFLSGSRKMTPLEVLSYIAAHEVWRASHPNQ